MTRRRPFAAKAVRSVQGARRTANQDRVLVDDELGVVLLADGAANRPAGDRAAELAINAAFAQIAFALNQQPTDDGEMMLSLIDAFRLASIVVERASQRDDALRNMTTTLVGAVFRGDHVFIASVGDSRAYRLRHAFLKQVTMDHVDRAGTADVLREGSYATPHVQRLTRAVGQSRRAAPDIHMELAGPEDIFLFCSNGLSDVVERREMAEIIASTSNLEAACDRLMQAAELADDDATAVLVKPAGVAQEQP